MKRIVMLVCVCAFAIGTFGGCFYPGEKTVSTPDKGMKSMISPTSADGTEHAIKLH